MSLLDFIETGRKIRLNEYLESDKHVYNNY